VLSPHPLRVRWSSTGHKGQRAGQGALPTCRRQRASLIDVVAHLGFGIRLGPLEIVVLALLFMLLPLTWYRALGPLGPALRPDGLLDRQPFGSIFVPWAAGPTAEPTTTGTKLRIAHPELIQRRGFRPGTSIRTGADRGFTA
jgi:hypothetical protein